MPYDGPYEVIKRGEKAFTIKVRSKETVVSIDRLKPAFTLVETAPDDREVTIRSQTALPVDGQQIINQQQQPHQEQPEQQQRHQRRSVRRVRFVDRYQAGFP